MPIDNRPVCFVCGSTPKPEDRAPGLTETVCAGCVEPAMKVLPHPGARVAMPVAWDRDGLVSEHDFANRYSLQHLCYYNASYTFCGARIRWMYVSPGDSRRCDRCYDIASRRDLVGEHGGPLLAGLD